MSITQLRGKVRTARRLVRDDSGAVTVDWVVLTAAVVILSIGAISALDGGIGGLITTINTSLTTAGTQVTTEMGTLNGAGGGGGGEPADPPADPE